jgi:hypothetical protein
MGCVGKWVGGAVPPHIFCFRQGVQASFTCMNLLLISASRRIRLCEAFGDCSGVWVRARKS